jgi:hypothetical protein
MDQTSRTSFGALTKFCAGRSLGNILVAADEVIE